MTELKIGDTFTIAGIGYNRSGYLIENGRYLDGTKTRSKIVSLKQFTVKNPYETNH